jgi:hypothetical protein
MMLSTFVDRIHNGKANNLTYANKGKEGLISVWKHEGLLVLTWEECPAGEQYDEATYTRDERYTFSTMDELLVFLAAHELSPESFTP